MVILLLLLLFAGGCARGKEAPPPPPDRAAALVGAVRSDSVAVIRRLLDAGVSPDTLAPDGTRPLTEAARHGRLAAASLLIDADAALDRRDLAGSDAMDYAIEFGHRDVVMLLVRAAARAAGENPATAAWFDSIARPAAPPGDWQRLLDGELASLGLEAAVVGGRESLVAALRHAAGIPNRTGYAPLLVAARFGDERAVAELLEAGASPDVEVVGHLHETPLMEAARDGYGAIATRLIRAGARVNHTDAARETALIWAVREGETEYARTLLDAGADPHLRNRDGDTALDIARQINHGDLIALLTSREHAAPPKGARTAPPRARTVASLVSAFPASR